MKNILSAFLILLVCSFIQSCSSDNIVNPPPGGGFGEYDNEAAQVCMTLSALCYVNENNPTFLRDSLIIQLSDTSYATKGEWTLDWGPALSPDGGNMMYIVKNNTLDNPVYALAIRGTDWCFPTNWKEDILNWILVDFPFGDYGDSVATGSLLGLYAILNLTDPMTGYTLFEYLTIQPNVNSEFYITGHSLGGALSTMLTAWFMDSGFTSKFKLKTYLFAPPSVGNSYFANSFKNKLQATGSECHRVYNSKDVVPRFWAEIDSILINQLPTQLPLEVEAVLIAVGAYLQSEGIVYHNVVNAQNVGFKNPTDCNYPVGSLDEYECYVGFQHSHNTYLELLNAPDVNFSYVPCDWEW